MVSVHSCFSLDPAAVVVMHRLMSKSTPLSDVQYPRLLAQLAHSPTYIRRTTPLTTPTASTPYPVDTFSIQDSPIQQRIGVHIPMRQ